MELLEAFLMARKHSFMPCNMLGSGDQGGRKGPHPKLRPPGTRPDGSWSQAHPLLSYPARWSLQHPQGHGGGQALDCWKEGKGDIWSS